MELISPNSRFHEVLVAGEAVHVEHRQAEAIIRHQLWGAFCMGFYSRKGPEGIFLFVAREGFRACVLSLMLGSSWASSYSCLSLYYRAMGDF